MTKRRAIAIEVVLWVFALFLAWVFIRQGGVLNVIAGRRTVP
jgi:hypothetical protein